MLIESGKNCPGHEWLPIFMQSQEVSPSSRVVSDVVLPKHVFLRRMPVYQLGLATAKLHLLSLTLGWHIAAK